MPTLAEGWAGAARQAQGPGGQAAALTGPAGPLCIVTLRLGQGLRAGWSWAPQLADGLRRVGRGPSPNERPPRPLRRGEAHVVSRWGGGGAAQNKGPARTRRGVFVLNRASSGLGCAGVLFCLWSAGNTDGGWAGAGEQVRESLGVVAGVSGTRGPRAHRWAPKQQERKAEPPAGCPWWPRA